MVKFAVIRIFLCVLYLKRVFHRSVFETLYQKNFLFHMVDSCPLRIDFQNVQSSGWTFYLYELKSAVLYVFADFTVEYTCAFFVSYSQSLGHSDLRFFPSIGRDAKGSVPELTMLSRAKQLGRARDPSNLLEIKAVNG